MNPPLFWRVINAIRRWSERDDRLLVDQWKAAYGPQPRKVIPFLNLTVRRAEKRRCA